MMRIKMILSLFSLGLAFMSVHANNVQVSWTSANSLELALDDQELSINVRPVTSNIPGVNIDCLFSGSVSSDPSSVVTVLGCHDDEVVTISVASRLIPQGIVDIKMEDGVASVIQEEMETHRRHRRSTEEIDYNDFVEPPPEPVEVVHSMYEGELPSSVDLETTLYYDLSLLGRFDNDHMATKQWLSKVVELSKPRLADPTLNVNINLKIKEAKHIERTLQADYANIVSLTDYEVGGLNSFFCYDIGGGILGIAYLNASCRTDGIAVNMNEFFTETNSELTSARVYVHELGHNLGMYHDFDTRHGGNGSPSSTNPCNGKGLMSYGVLQNGPDAWSSCSNSDFEAYYRQEGHECLLATETCDEEASLSVVQASSIFRNDKGNWGPQLALTPPSDSWIGYWHSDENEQNPWIEFRMVEAKEITVVTVTDRYDCCAERFEDVEVRVGASSDYDSAVSCGKLSYSGSTSYKYVCPANTVGPHVFIKKMGTTSKELHVNHVSVKVKGECGCSLEKAQLTVVQASSVFRNDVNSWGPHLALTPVSDAWIGYWHSEDGQQNPWIEFKLTEAGNIAYVDVTDRLDCCAERFEQVEVRVGASFESGVSCGVKSYEGATVYRYTCPDNTVGENVFIKKIGTTEDVLHINHVTVHVRNCV